jgi:hypothetical protein
MKHLHIATAVIELGAGLALLACPSMTVLLLIGSPLDTYAALALGRVAGAALFALAIANWLASFDARSCASRGLVSAMVVYNACTAVILGFAGIRASRRHRLVAGSGSSRGDGGLVHCQSPEKTGGRLKHSAETRRTKQDARKTLFLIILLLVVTIFF